MQQAVSSAELSLVPIAAAATERDVRAHPVGPGWFDSSWDLRRGLEVREDWFGEERLHGWIEDFLRAQRSVARTASPSESTAIA